MRTKLCDVTGELTTLPGCSQVVVSHDVFLPEKLRGIGKGKTANLARQALAFLDLGYDAMICTVDSANESQKKVLTTTGWQQVGGFHSRKTGHYVEIWICYAVHWLDRE